MRNRIVAVLLLAVVVPFPQFASAQKESACPPSWHIGTLVGVITSEPEDPAQHLYVLPGYGIEADDCIPHPGRCEQLVCTAPGCSDAWALHCHRYLVANGVITDFVRLSDTPGACP